jgi:ribosomal protein S18 acetylase RimI-like enzyme
VSGGDLERAVEFLLRVDRGGTRRRETPLGPLVLTPELPRRWDSNYLLVERPADMETILAGADEAFGAAGLGHRKLTVLDETLGARLRQELPREWLRQSLVVMVRRRPPDRERDLSPVVEVDEARLRPGRAAELSRYEWSRDPEVVREILDAKLLLTDRADIRFLAALVDGEVASWADLYLGGGVAQIEDVGTLERFRNRGLASAVVLAAVRAAEEAGAELIFLIADEDDWPSELYGRLGFDTIGRLYDFVRPAPTSARPA